MQNVEFSQIHEQKNRPHVHMFTLRLVDNLMTQAFMLGAQLEKPSLDADLIMAAVNNLALS